jgi:hypothetical protein
MKPQVMIDAAIAIGLWTEIGIGQKGMENPIVGQMADERESATIKTEQDRELLRK